MESPPLSRRERERLARRDAMIDAAMAVFADKGYEHATLDEVAARAEFGKGTLYNYFPEGKQEIMFSLLDRVFGEMQQWTAEHFAEAEAQGQSGRDMLRSYIFKHVAYLSERRDVFAILMQEVHRIAFDMDGEKVRRMVEMREGMVDQIAAPIQRAIDRGEIRDLPPHIIAHMIVGNIKGHLLAVTLEAHADPTCSVHEYADPERAAELIATTLLDGLALSSSADA
jgi:AcrR family transcriptional regulator